jgi:hypothetical protein
MNHVDHTPDVPNVAGSAYPHSEAKPGTLEHFFESAWGRAVLFTGCIGAPVLWASQMQTNYGLVEWACEHNKRIVLQWINVGFFLAAIACGLISLWIWFRVGPHWPRTEDEGTRARTRLLAVIGVFSALLFCLLILAQGIPIILFGPCEL